MQKKNFTASNLNFVARLAIFNLSVLAMIGVNFPDSPEAIAGQISTSLSSGGVTAVILIVAVSVIMPIYNLIRTKPKITLASVIGNPNFAIYAGTFAFGMLILLGINIPEGTAEELVGAIYAKDWSALISIASANVLDPIVRYFLDKKNNQVAALEGPST